MVLKRDLEAMARMVFGPLPVELDDEPEHVCPLCDGTGKEFWEPADPTRRGHWRDCSECSA